MPTRSADPKFGSFSHLEPGRARSRFRRPAPFPPADERSIELKLKTERTSYLFRQNKQGLVALAVYGTSCLVVSFDQLPFWFLTVWSVLLALSAVARIVLTSWWQRSQRRPLSMSAVRRARRLMQGLLFISGASWGAMGWAMAGTPELTPQLVTALAVIYMSAGAVVAYSASLAASLMVILPAMIPWALAMLLGPEFAMKAMGVTALLYVVVAIYASLNFHRFVLRTLRLTIDNATLARDLREEIAIKDLAREELRESQGRLRLALDSSGAATWDWDLETGVFSCEGNLAVIHGLANRSFQGTLEEYLELVQIEDREKLRGWMEAAAKLGSEIDGEARIVWPDGSIRRVAYKGSSDAINGYSPRWLSGICWDTTDKHARETLRRERAESEASNRAKSILLANASHEIRTPLAAINGFAEMILRSESLDEQARADIEVIARNGKYLVALVNDLIDLSKIETGQIYIQKSAMSPESEIIESIQLAQPLARTKGLSIDLKIETPLPAQIESDATRFREIVINLLSNAIKYSTRGLISVRVRFDKNGSNGRLAIVVVDEGIGIDEETQRQLFRPFVRSSRESVQSTAGSGLGLALSRDLARLLGGDLILLNSTENFGTAFEFSLGGKDAIGAIELTPPLAFEAELRPARSLDTQLNAPSLLSSDHSRRILGRKILVADDSNDLQQILQRVLEYEGARVDVCSTGLEAIDRALSNDYEFVLMDIKMPNVDGYTATRELRSRGYRKTIVALTAQASIEDRQRCLDAGFDSYVSKPVDFDHLIAELVGHAARDTESSTAPFASA